MLSREENEMMTRVGPGTPAGEMLRRYWWPVGFTEEIKAKSRPGKIKLLGEEFVLFRDGAGQLGILALHCSHRGASLEFGRVEDQGIRCCYHGWVYDAKGRCLEQPAEPEESTFKDRVQQPAYRAEELGGLVFAYIGPDPAPLLPKYDLLVHENGTRVLNGWEEHCNWLQRAENHVDQSHIPFLHASGYPDMAFKKPILDYQKTWYGIRASLSVAGRRKPKITHCIFPSHLRFSSGRVGQTPHHRLAFRVPIDDTNTISYVVTFYPGSLGSGVVLKTKEVERREAGQYGRVEDGYWGIASHDQDLMALEGLGPIYDRTTEHLAATDRGVVMLRKMIQESIAAVSQGKDSVGVIRDEHAHEVISFDASIEEIEALGQAAAG
jgi:5,5'-dehydrodivanillate O-demethylase oxygenase subunit